jgi:hypothetical protein
MKGKKAASRKPSQATLMRKDKGEKIYTEKNIFVVPNQI